MPRNRRPVDRAEKRSEIVDAATTLFTEAGFDGTPVSRIATAAGVTANTIYWYFTDKDGVLVAALDGIVQDALSRLVTLRDLNSRDRILWVVGELQRYHRLVDTVHSRAAESPQINEWHNNFHSMADALVTDELRHSGVSKEKIEAMTKVVVFVVEALLTHPQSDEDMAAIVDVLFPAGRP